MDEQKLTDWFPPEVLPARPGWYQREWPSRPSSATPDFFDGQNWFIGYNWRPYKYPLPVPLRWRGLADPPLTDWFDPDTPPEREGVYEIEGYDGFRHFAYWTPGHGWGFTYSDEVVGNHPHTIEMARLARRENGTFAHARRWRGLAVQP